MKQSPIASTHTIHWLAISAIALFSLLFFNCSVLDSNDSNSLSGIVIAGDNPVSAKVALIDSDTILLETESDSMGRYSFSTVPDGIYILTSRIDWAFGALYDSVSVGRGAEQNVNLSAFKKIPVVFEGESPILRWYGDDQVIDDHANDTATVLVYLDNTSMYYTMVYPDTTLELIIIDAVDSLSIIQSDTTIIKRDTTGSIPELIIDKTTVHIREETRFSFHGDVVTENPSGAVVATLMKQGLYTDVLYDTVLDSEGGFTFLDIPLMDTGNTVVEPYSITIRDGWNTGAIIDSGIDTSSTKSGITLSAFKFMPFVLPENTVSVKWFSDTISIGDSLTLFPFIDESVSHVSIFFPDTTVYMMLRDSALRLQIFKDGIKLVETDDSRDPEHRWAYLIEL
ncbi:MAG: hypothetical protein OCD76_08950 [Reichenbachiella sp.]